MDQRDRHRGCLMGLAVGDAVGTTLEFKAPGSFDPIEDMIGGGPFGLVPGQWTDDTSMALCMGESLVECQGFDAEDQMRRYLRWWREGYMSSTDECFDIGATTASSLARFEQTGESFCGPTAPNTAGNGPIMRLAPVPMYYALRPSEAIEKSAESSRTTHGARTCLDACRYLAGLLVGAIKGIEKQHLLSPLYCPIPDYWSQHSLADEVDQVARGSFAKKQPPAIRGSGYVVHTLEAALWAFHKSKTFREGCLMVVNLGDDADTTGAVFGQIAGAYYGESGIPAEWREKLAKRELISELADRLWQQRE